MRYLNYTLLLFGIMLLACSAQNKTQKINGISFVASPNPVDSTHIKPVIKVNANAAAIMPFGFIKDLNHPEIIHNTNRQWFGETRAGAKQYISELKKANISIMIKPQIWVWDGKFTGGITMESETDWKTLEDSYTNFIMEYVGLATEVNAEVFCIGTELESFIKNRPQYWKTLIKNIRKIYFGKLTYAANWDEFWHTPFWNEIDYIGIDAYFPISNMQTPTIENAIKGWETHKQGLAQFSKKYNKPILFTEFGYRSVDYTGKAPWRYDRSMTSINMSAQVNATTALFEALWKEDWFAGGYLWKWFTDYDKSGGLKNNQFTPQNKPVEAVIKKYYSQF